jgi:hypothetical protein
MTIYRPYTYLIKHIPSGMVYYGVRWKNIKLKLTPEQDFWKHYFTRSKLVANLIEDTGKDSFVFEVRKTFDTVQQARDWETKVLRRMKVLTKPDVWLNRTDNTAILNIIHPRGTLGKKLPFNKGCSENNKIAKLGNTNTKGTKWIHDGNGNAKMILKSDSVPEGFVLGTGRTNKRPDLAEYNRTRHQHTTSS